MSDARRIKGLLRERVEELARYLFPNGRREGVHWCVGDITGTPGHSFKICLTGDKAGLWGDFEGAGKHSRSLLDLWMQTRNVDFKTALREAGQWCGEVLHGANGNTPDVSTSKPKQAASSFDWRACVEAFTQDDLGRLGKWRGYSPAFCSWLYQRGVLGLYDRHVAFPIHDRGKIVAAHYRLRDGSWRVHPYGITIRLLVLGDTKKAATVHVFESQWDTLAVADKLALHEKEGIALICTRGASNGKLVAGLIPSQATVFAWPQNDQPDRNGKRAGEEWLKAVATHAGAAVQVVRTPEPFKDVNEWTLAGGTPYELQHAIANAQRRARPEPRAALASGSLISPVLSCEVLEEYPNPLAPAAFHGLAGKIVRLIEPHTEADPAALLIQFHAAFGNVIGHDLYFVADGAHHSLNLYNVLVGQSSKGRKGTAWSHIARVMERAAPDWRENCVINGLSSGEGLIWEVHDDIEETKPVRQKGRHTGEYETFIANHGIEDKRRLVIEAEFANVLKVMSREGNTLSPVIRSAWDFGDLNTIVKNSPAKSTGAHIAIIGHITRDELRRLLTQTESANGFANRFCWVAVKRSKCLPDGGAIDTVNFNDVVMDLTGAINFADDFVEMSRDSQAKELWHAVYPQLSEGQPGMFGAVTGRAEAQVMRISAIYALLDRSREIRLEHLEAGLAVWEYCEQSARWIFGTTTGDRNADKILRALRHAPNGLTKTEISAQVFNRHASSADIDEALRLLHGLKMAYYEVETTDGAPVQRWFFTGESAK
jgi:Protein of unknown function (DUF3987)